METKEVVSKIWPPVPEEVSVVTVYRHRDGRTVRHVHGPVCENAEQKALIEKLGNIAGFFGSVGYYESFPDEPVCCGCVAPIKQMDLRPDGSTLFRWASSAAYNSGVRGDYCENCRRREAEELRRVYLSGLKVLRMTE